MKVKLTRAKILQYFKVLTEYLARGGEQDFKLNYGIIKNKDKLEKICIDTNIQLNLYDLEREGLCEKHADKDEDGNPIIVENKYKGLDHNEEFRKDFDELKTRINTYKDEEVTVDAYEISQSLIPLKMLGLYQEAIMPFIEKVKKNDNEKEVKIN